MRIAIDDAMDIHGGQGRDRRPAKTISEISTVGAGRHHRRGRQYPREISSCFGQGAIRAHPFLLDE